MTRYAVDHERHALVATWGTGGGDIAVTVTTLPSGVDEEVTRRLAGALSALCSHLWDAYVHPASAYDSVEPNTEGWRRAGDRAAFGGVLSALRSPNLPSNGMLVQSYVAIEESAHRAGRVLHEIGDDALLAAVCADVAREIDAVDRAELGDLSGRAQQAVQLDRTDASPNQVAAANALFEKDPFGDPRLFTDFDPTAAAVAAAHWLAAAADVASERADRAPTQVVLEADDIEALPVESPTVVLQLIADGETPHDIVTLLVRDAMTAGRGQIPDLHALLDRVAEAEDRAAELGGSVEENRAALLPTRTTSLDPQRPARDLLEDLLTGIRGCWLIWREYDDDPDSDIDDVDVDEDDDAGIEAQQERRTDAFLQALREQAALDANRLN